MSHFDTKYRPRRPTAEEDEAAREHELAGRQRRVKRIKRDHDFASSRDSGLVMSSISGIGYRDYTLGPSKPTKTRSQLDKLAYDHRQPLARPPSSTVPSLQSICIARVAEEFSAPGVWDQLDRFTHLPHVPAFIDAVLEQVDHLPFGVWARFAAVFGQELPPRRRTYRGLCVSDEKEIACLKVENEVAAQEWAQAGPTTRQLQPSPSFFLAVLDLAHDTTLSDLDLSKLRGVAPLLAVLKLDYTRITDDGLGWLVRHANQDGCYRHLEVLSLKGLKKVTNEGVLKLSTLQSLRMLDLRETACMKQVKAQLTIASRNASPPPPPWGVARFRQELDRIGLELELFGPSLSLSRVLTFLHCLAHRLNPLSDPTPPSKPLCIHLDAIGRQTSTPAPSSAPKSAEDLYIEQMALSSKAKNAAYNQAYGAVTSTVSISRRLLEESGMAETEKGAAFRFRNDAVAGGSYVGPGKTGGRSLFDVGQRKLTPEGARLGPISDSEEEAEIEEGRRKREEEAVRTWDAQPARGAASFYRPPRPFVSEPIKREVKCADPSDLILLRHLPYRPPYNTPVNVPPPPLQIRTEVAPSVKRRDRPRENDMDDLLLSFAASARATRKAPKPSRPAQPSNPFSARRAAAVPPPPRRPTSATITEPAKKGLLLARPLGMAPMFNKRR